MRVLEAFETSEQLAKEGRQCSIEFGGKVIALVRVRPSDASLNPDYRRELAEITIGAKGQEIDEALDRELLHRVFCRTVITGWEWTDPEDQADPSLEFEEEKALALFKKAPKFFEGIQRASKAWSNYRAAHEEDAAGN